MSRKPIDSYTASVTRLRLLVAKLESAEVDVDELEAVVKESVELVTNCRTRLRATQTSVDSLLVGLQDNASAPATSASPPSALLSSRTAPPDVSDSDEFDPFADD